MGAISCISNYLLNCFMIVCGFIEVFPINWICME